MSADTVRRLAVAAALGLALCSMAAPAIASSDPVAESPKDQRSLILKVIRGAKARYSDCYRELVARDPEAAGKIKIGFTIRHGGKVRGAKVVASSFEDESFHGCLLGVVSRLTFPWRGADIEITYPMIFKPDDVPKQG